MARYFLDQEFHEYHYKPLFGRKVHIIDLISIGIACEDGRKYYAVSKDFDIKAAWHSYQIEQVSGDQRNIYPEGIKKYWLRENVLKPIWEELSYREYREDPNFIKQEFWDILDGMPEEKRLPFFVSEMLPYGWRRFDYSDFKRLVKKYGKSNKQIAEEVTDFCSSDKTWKVVPGLGHKMAAATTCEFAAVDGYVRTDPEFYGYFADYDWVLFCSLFGKMINLPKGFPYYCKDLKQMLDDKADNLLFSKRWKLDVLDTYIETPTGLKPKKIYSHKEIVDAIKKSPNYPKQENEHNALADAVWNLALYKFLQSF